ncbi:MAG: 1-phosphofructokinase family hexose kinase [Marinicaulis sp.]|nr:1-phosphofructokinase family hexose kinase [Marinicaulis sp.]NNL89139.1 1-phosphofructokinase family hexose kinase [Marinicaulis sp.]
MPRIVTLTPNPTFDFAVDADFVEANRKLRCKNPQSHPGGGGVNVARAAHRLGGDVLAIVAAGGPYGDAVIELLEEEGVPTRVVPIEADTRIAFHVHDLKEDHEYRFNLPGGAISESEVDAILAAIEDEVGQGDFLVGSGSLPSGEPVNFWARAARTAKTKGAKFVLDSINGVAEALDEGIFLLRQNRYEYPLIAGGELQWPGAISAFAARLVDAGKAEKVAITHGGDGSILASKNGIAKTFSVPVKAESAVGAGDSFVAAMTIAMSKDWSDESAIQFGMCGAAATRMTPGTSLFRKDDVERLFRNNFSSAKNT